jgi:hypothetical protein
MNEIRTGVTRARVLRERYVELDEGIASKIPHANDDAQGRDGIDDISHRIRVGVRSTVTDEKERDMQRWLVTSFLGGAFELKRHQCCDACMSVYGVRHERSRELFDMTLLAIRQVMFDSLPPRPPIAAGRLIGTRGAWVLRYRPLLNDSEFDRFFVLTRGLVRSWFCLSIQQIAVGGKIAALLLRATPFSMSYSATPPRFHCLNESVPL